MIAPRPRNGVSAIHAATGNATSAATSVAAPLTARLRRTIGQSFGSAPQTSASAVVRLSVKSPMEIEFSQVLRRSESRVKSAYP